MISLHPNEKLIEFIKGFLTDDLKKQNDEKLLLVNRN